MTRLAVAVAVLAAVGAGLVVRDYARFRRAWLANAEAWR